MLGRPLRSPAPTGVEGDRNHRSSRRRTATASLVAVATLAIMASTITGVSQAPSAGAQAENIRVTVRVEPETPDPGDDVSVQVRVRGCPPGDARVEAYLSTTDGATQSAALMGRAPLITTMFYQAHATIALPKAIEGWYGVRVVCGSYRPDRVPLPNTTFAVGAKPSKRSQLIGNSVIEGGVLRLEGDGCPGSKVEYQVAQTGLHAGAFIANGELATNADGTWGGDVTFPVTLAPGAAEVKARCVLQNRYGDVVTINYGGQTQVTVLRAPETTVPPAVTTPAATPTTPTGP